jgi:transglutaminase-like putative cysteine protease
VTTAAPPARAPHLAWAELALAGVTAAVVYGFSRLFASWAFLWPLLGVAAYAHLSAMLLRRRGVGVPLSALVSTAGFVLLASWLWFPSTTRFLLPGPATLDAVRDESQRSWEAFRELAAPVPVQDGFLLAAAAALLFAVFLADWAAFRLWSPVEAIVPATTMFVFCTLLGAERQRVGSAVLFAAAALVFVLVHRVARLEGRSGWLTADVEPGGRALLRAGGALAVLAVLGGVVVGPRLPGAGDDALLDWRADQGGGGSRVTISPLVDIRERLVTQSTTEVFTVTASRPAYWRLTSLEAFDGQIWRSGGRYGQASGELPAGDLAGGDRLTQDYEITGLNALWLPAAYQPTEVVSDRGVRYQPASSTLIVDTQFADSDGFRYQVESTAPAFDEATLRGATNATLPAEVVDPYLTDPSGLSERARRTAAEVTSAASTPYDRARALQDWFRDTFTYDLSGTGAGHDGNAIDDFLESRRGYCEQFAGTFAAMARSLGIPARVAVGFTWGDVVQRNADGSARYSVEGRHAHAWPEVYLDGFGWVAFEPTPGRGAPGMDRYNDVPEEQDDGTGAAAAPESTTTSAPASAQTTAPLSPEDLVGLLSQDTGSSSAAPTEAPASLPARALDVARSRVLIALAAGTVAYLVVVPAWWSLHRRRRRAGADEPDERVRVAWTESVEDLELVGAVRRPQETHDEFAHRAGAAVPGQAHDLASLARATDVATFAPGGLDDTAADRAEATSAAIAASVRSRTPRWRRLVRRLDPRPLLGRPPTGPRHSAHESRP